MKKGILLAIVIFSAKFTFAQTITPEEYISKYKDIAIREMKRMGVPAAITLAQGILETESGNSVLVKKSNNHFGIKCKASWTAGGVSHDDDAPQECFRVYKTSEDSYRDHSNFLRGGERYAFLFKLDPSDYKGWAYGLKQAGYATNPKYPLILIKHIEQYNLQQYSLSAVDEVPKFDTDKFTSDPEKKVVIEEERPQPIESQVVDQESIVETVLDDQDKAIFINGSKCVYGKKGTSLLVIATKNNINLNKLLEYNELGEDGLLSKDQIVFLQNKRAQGNKDFHLSQEGETLYDIAQKNGVQYKSLLTYNKLQDGAKITAGSKIFLKPNAAAGSIKTAIVEKNTKYYEVQPKDGLYSIAKKNGVNVQQLREWNNLETDSLQIGQQLIVSQ
ncbi:MAG: glucosaminidase domain-containing protein [Bacteroidota bacterium]